MIKKAMPETKQSEIDGINDRDLLILLYWD